MSLNNWITVIGGILTIISILKWAKEKGSVLFNLVVILLGVSLVIVSLIKNTKDDNKEKEKAKIDSLKDSKIVSLQNGMKELLDKSVKDDEFQKYLRDKPFNIIRDSISNKPMQINTYETHINKADNVHIGTKNN